MYFYTFSFLKSNYKDYCINKTYKECYLLMTGGMVSIS